MTSSRSIRVLAASVAAFLIPPFAFAPAATPETDQPSPSVPGLDPAAGPRAPAEPKWGESRHGLRTRLSGAKQTFSVGEPVTLTLEVANFGDEPRSYQTPAAPHNDSLTVIDQLGRAVPYLGGLSQVHVQTKTLQPGETAVLCEFDLAESHYLRRPGRYRVRWPGEILIIGHEVTEGATDPESPPSAPLEFDVVADPPGEFAKDGDPVGRLLPLVKDDWWLVAGATRPDKLQPGGNRSEVPGRFLSFQYVPTGYKGDSGVIWLWLTDERAAEQPAVADWPPASESLSQVDRWHVYAHIDDHARAAWPTAAVDIQRALVKAVDLAANDPLFPQLPPSPRQLIDTLILAGERHTIDGPRLDYVQPADIYYLASLLDSQEPCAFVHLSSSSIYYPGRRSTVGHEAAYLIEGFWKRYYPPSLTSQQFEPDVAAIKLWYGMWKNLEQLKEQQ